MRRSTTLMAAAAALLLLASLSAAYMSIVSYGERREEAKTRQMFVEWKAKYNKTYSSIGEEELRYGAFKLNLRNADLRYGLKALNGFGDLTGEEFQRRFGRPRYRDANGVLLDSA